MQTAAGQTESLGIFIFYYYYCLLSSDDGLPVPLTNSRARGRPPVGMLGRRARNNTGNQQRLCLLRWTRTGGESARAAFPARRALARALVIRFHRGFFGRRRRFFWPRAYIARTMRKYLRCQIEVTDMLYRTYILIYYQAHMGSERF